MGKITKNELLLDANNEFAVNISGDANSVNNHTAAATPHTTEQVDLIGMINEVNDELYNSSTVSPTVAFGMNNKITNTAGINISPSFSITGNTVINLLGKDGNCEDTSKWVVGGGSTISLDSTNKVYGGNGIKITLASSTGSICNLISKYNIDITKYYLFSAWLKNGNATNIGIAKDNTGGGNTIGSPAVTSTSAFNRVGIVIQPSDFASGNYIDVVISGTSGQYAYIDGIMLNQITSTEYALGATALLTKYPYNDSYACLQNPYIEVRHDNMVINGNGEQGTAWWQSINNSSNNSPDTSNPIKLINGYFSINAINDLIASVEIPVKPNTTYTFIGVAYEDTPIIGYIPFVNLIDAFKNYGANILPSTKLLNTSPSNFSYTFTTASDTATLKLGVKVYDACNVYLKQVMLVEGSVAPSQYLPCRLERTALETKLTSDDSITYNNGEITGQIWWKHRTLYGKDYDWQYENDFTGYKSIKITSLPSGLVQDGQTATKYDGKILNKMAYGGSWSSYSYDYATLGGTSGIFGISVADTDTGWAESINPNADEVKAFMNGWYAIGNNGTRYTSWWNITDTSNKQTSTTGYPSGTATTLTVASTNTTSITVADASIFKAGDSIYVYGVTGITTISSISGNVLTMASNMGTAAIGNTVIRCDNGSTDTRVLTYCKNNIAPNYDGYQLHYKLANPEIITDDNCHIHGDVPLLDSGDNYLYLDSGMVLGEVAKPAYSNSASKYAIGFTAVQSDSGYSPLKYKTKPDLLFSPVVYKNGICDITNWFIGSSSGDTYVLCNNFDSNATYTVDYKILATQAPQVGIIGCTYSQDIATTINKLNEEINNRQEHDSILDQITDKSLYEVVTIGTVSKSSYLFPWVIGSTGTIGYINMAFNMAYKKATPTINVQSYTIYCCDVIVNNKFAMTGLSINSNQVLLQFMTTDATTISNLKAYGAYGYATVTADCRGRI